MAAKFDYEKSGQFLKALAHPVRLKIVLRLINRQDCNVNTLALYFKLPQSTISQHLAVLKNKEIVTFYKSGVRACYRVVDERARAIIDLLR